MYLPTTKIVGLFIWWSWHDITGIECDLEWSKVVKVSGLSAPSTSQPKFLACYNTHILDIYKYLEDSILFVMK